MHAVIYSNKPLNIISRSDGEVIVHVLSRSDQIISLVIWLTLAHFYAFPFIIVEYIEVADFHPQLHCCA